MYRCVLDRRGRVLLHRNLPTDPQRFLGALAPFRPDVVVACGCTRAWYWLADLCRAAAIPFALGHALAMTHIHGGTSKSDRLDAGKLAAFLRGVV